MSVAEVCEKLQALQRQRAWYMKSRNMVNNRLVATVAGEMGYHNSLPDNERKELFKQAQQRIKRILTGEPSHLCELVKTTNDAIQGFDGMRVTIEKSMVKTAKLLPVVDWVEAKDQRGFGILFLAIVIGETGDLVNYSSPGKVWKRLGCAPYTKDGETLMGATWRGKNKGIRLEASDWEEFGYSPRRRSISYLIGENLIRQNSEKDKETSTVIWTGPYRRRYDYAKQRASEVNPEWIVCSKCKGNGCKDCKQTGEVWMRCHRHGMLLAAKLLLKNLWIEWNPELAVQNHDWR